MDRTAAGWHTPEPFGPDEVACHCSPDDPKRDIQIVHEDDQGIEWECRNCKSSGFYYETPHFVGDEIKNWKDAEGNRFVHCSCGADVPLVSGWANPCPGVIRHPDGRVYPCGREYNLSGQLLAPRSQWGAETGETFTDRDHYELIHDLSIDNPNRGEKLTCPDCGAYSLAVMDDGRRYCTDEDCGWVEGFSVKSAAHETGQCYPWAWRYVLENPEAELVHGYAQFPDLLKGAKFGHAWVEHNGVAKDWQGQERGRYPEMPVEEYYQRHFAEPVKRYTSEDAMKAAMKEQHYGPWEQIDNLRMAKVIPVYSINSGGKFVRFAADELTDYFEERRKQGLPLYVALRKPALLEARGGKIPIPGAMPYDVSSEGVPRYKVMDLGYNPDTGIRENADENEVGGAPELTGVYIEAPAGRRGEVLDFNPEQRWALVSIPLNYPEGGDIRLHPHSLVGWVDYTDVRPIEVTRPPHRRPR